MASKHEPGRSMPSAAIGWSSEMMTAEDKDAIVDQIGNLFEGLDLNDVADILAVQLALLTSQGSDSVEDAVIFLNEIRDEAEAILRTELSDEDEDEDGGDEAPRQQ
jgi:hypothetical protein